MLATLKAKQTHTVLGFEVIKALLARCDSPEERQCPSSKLEADAGAFVPQ
jgi:hypothetical protein